MKFEFFKRKGKLWRVLVCAIIFNFQYSNFNLSHAQVAGLSTLSILDFTTSARTAGLGMGYLAVYDADMNVGLDNPSLVSGRVKVGLALNYTGLFRGGNFGSIAYAIQPRRWGSILVAFRFHSYGTFTGYDEAEQWQGKFTAGDYMLSVGWGLPIDSNFSIGATFKPVLSQYESYTAVALVFDLAGSYVSDDKSFTASLLARNIGAQIMTFDQSVEKVPFELTAEVSYKLSRAPFRFFLAARNLQRWNLIYDDPLEPTTVVDPFTGEVTTPGWAAEFFDNLGRHIGAGVEVYIGRLLFVDIGYNYRQAREIRSIEAFNLSAMSFGVGLRIKHFEFVYSRNNYHLTQAPNYLSLTYKF